MNWPWVSRKRYDEAGRRYAEELTAESNSRIRAICDRDKHERNSKTLQSVVTTLRDETRELRETLVKLKAENLDKDAVIEAQRKEIERLQKSLPTALNTRRKHFHGAGGIREQLEAEAANEKKSTLPEGAN